MCHLSLNALKTMFADDTTLVHAGNNLNRIALELENDLDVVADWLKHNRLLLNVKKSNTMIFKKYHRCLRENWNQVWRGDNGLKALTLTKFTLLGVTLDEYLAFDLHTISICSKVNWKISVLKKSSYLFDLKFRIILLNCSL